MHFLQKSGAAFKLIDAETVRASHETAASVGIVTDSSGRFKLSGQGDTRDALVEGEEEEEEEEGGRGIVGNGSAGDATGDATVADRTADATGDPAGDAAGAVDSDGDRSAANSTPTSSER